jgi:hypothetical protein
LYFCWECVTDEDGGRCWDTFDILLNENDINFRDSILIGFLKFKSGKADNFIYLSSCPSGCFKIFQELCCGAARLYQARDNISVSWIIVIFWLTKSVPQPNFC